MVEVLRERLGDVLVRESMITEEQLREALQYQRKKGATLPQALVELGFVSEDDIVVSLGEQLGVPHIKLKSYSIDSAIIQLVPESTARQYHLIPLSKVGNTLTVVMSDPLNIFAIDDLKFLTGCDIEAIVSTESDIAAAIEKYYGTGSAAIAGLVGEVEDERMEMVRIDPDEADELKRLENEANDAPLVRLVETLLINAVKEHASDIHVEPEENRVCVRYRIDGRLREVASPPKTIHAAIVSRIKVMSKLNIAERRLPQDGRTRVRFQGREIDFRVSTLPLQYGEKVVLRVLDKSAVVTSLDKLGFDPDSLEKFKYSLNRPHGIILLTGPTGSGKTTTLYAALLHVASREKNVITVEDPVEYELPGINQVQVKPDIGLSFAAGLRSILRQDPDIIMLGEMRDTETAEIAVKAALTGHLVLSTLHTNDAPSAVTRMVDMGIEPFLVASSTVLIAAQRLVRRICSRCAEPFETDAKILDSLGLRPGEATFYRGAGCKRCGDRGYKGRAAVLEVMLLTREIQSLIVQNRSAPEIREVARQQGMRSLRENALALAMQGLTTLEEVLTVTVDETPTFAASPEPEVRATSAIQATIRETGLRPV
jgi:type IV pilus assembly protein PilB